MKSSLAFLTLLIGLPLSVQAAVWVNQDQWSVQREQHYQQWVATNWVKDYFAKPGPLQGMSMDCAKAVYSMRFAYSYLHGLPFAVHDPTGGGRLITNSITKFDDLPVEARPKAFLRYIYSIVHTSTLPRDSYPVAVNRAALTSGDFLRTDQSHHHSWTVKSFSNAGIPFLLFGSRPPVTVLYEREAYPTEGFVFPNGLNPEAGTGFRAFRWPGDLLKAEWAVPGYSLEQYQIPLNEWRSNMQKRMQLVAETPVQKVERILNNVCREVRDRVKGVNMGLDVRDRLRGACFSARDYDEQSTPSRDERMRGAFMDLADAVRENSTLPGDLRQRVQAVLMGEESIRLPADQHSYCQTEVAPGHSLTLGQIYARSVNRLLSSNPNDPLEARWGEVSSSPQAQRCPIYE